MGTRPVPWSCKNWLLKDLNEEKPDELLDAYQGKYEGIWSTVPITEPEMY
jgi:hypothetical protein